MPHAQTTKANLAHRPTSSTYLGAVLGCWRAQAAFSFGQKSKILSENTPTQRCFRINLEQKSPTNFFLQVKEMIWLERSAIFISVKLDSRALCLLEVGRIYGQFGAILPTVQWCQVATLDMSQDGKNTISYHILVIRGHLGTIGGVQFHVLV